MDKKEREPFWVFAYTKPLALIIQTVMIMSAFYQMIYWFESNLMAFVIGIIGRYLVYTVLAFILYKMLE